MDELTAGATGVDEQSLAMAPAGQRVRIIGYRGGRMLRARLLALGLNLGREVDRKSVV
jgi:Fe2+ transport system protein FeoA